MVTAASPFFACMQLTDKWCCWRFEKTFVLQKKLSFWLSEVALPFIPAPCSGVVCNSCLGIWFAEVEVNGLPALDSRCDLDDSVVWTSIIRSERALPCWGSLEVANFAVLALCMHSSCWLLFETTFGKIISVQRVYVFVLRDQSIYYVKLTIKLGQLRRLIHGYWRRRL